MNTPASVVRAIAYWSAVTLGIVNAISAGVGGVGILATNGLGMPTSMLSSGPFPNFSVPGLILLVVVGGTQLVSAVLLIARREVALVWTAVAGLGMVIWIFVETGIIQGLSWLQALYFATGMAQVVAVLALLGIVSWLPREPLRH